MTSDSAFARNLSAPYYAVIFASRLRNDARGYDAMAARMSALAAGQPGYLGEESARGADGFGITVSYWSSPDAIRAWKANADHVIAQETGIREWYQHYELRVARVERSYWGPEDRFGAIRTGS